MVNVSEMHLFFLLSLTFSIKDSWAAWTGRVDCINFNFLLFTACNNIVNRCERDSFRGDKENEMHIGGQTQKIQTT